MSDAFPKIFSILDMMNEWYSCNRTFFFRTFLAFDIIPIHIYIYFKY